MGFTTTTHLALIYIVLCAYKWIPHMLKRRFRANLTALDDIPLLSVPRETKKVRGTVVICGGSIGGLFSARVCSKHFENVIIVEPETWVATKDGLQDRHREPSTPDHPRQKRSHVAQYTALHAYHPFVSFALQQLFPDLELELKREGARLLPVEAHTHLSGVPLLPPDHLYPNGSLPKAIWATRPVFETTLRRMVMETCPNVKYVSGSVTGLVQSNLSSGVISLVKIRYNTGVEGQISTPLVIDCTGPALGGLRWLKDLPQPPSNVKFHSYSGRLALQDLKTTFDHKMAYTTCEFNVPPELHNLLLNHGFPMDYESAANLYIYFPNSKAESLNLIIQRREQNFIQMACGGWNFHERITSISDIRSFLTQLVPTRPIPQWLFAMLDLFEQEKVPATYTYSRCPPAVYVQYHRAKNLPSNFIAIGDSLMQSNPVAGQGCTKACVEAVTLNALLARCVPTLNDGNDSEDTLPRDFSRTFFAAVARRTGHVWGSLKSIDYNFQTTTPIPGENLRTTDAWTRAYTAVYIRLATRDPYVAGVLYDVSNWLAPPVNAFLPGIIWRVAWHVMKTYLRIGQGSG